MLLFENSIHVILTIVVADRLDAVLGIPAEGESHADRKILIRIELLGRSGISCAFIERVVGEAAAARGCSRRGEISPRVVSIDLRIIGGIVGIGDVEELIGVVVGIGKRLRGGP